MIAWRIASALAVALVVVGCGGSSDQDAGSPTGSGVAAPSSTTGEVPDELADEGDMTVTYEDATTPRLRTAGR